MDNLDWRKWFWRPRAIHHPSLRVLVFPGIGSSALSFSHWLEWLPSDVELLVVQYPGRGARANEVPAQCLLSLSDHLAKAWVNFLAQATDAQTIIFGHSLGALVGYECVDALGILGPEYCPDQFMVSSLAAPNVLSDLDSIVSGYSIEGNKSVLMSELPSTEFQDIIRKGGGAPVEILEHPELWRLLEPVLRSDIQLIEQWTFRPREPLDMPIIAWWASNDQWFSQSDLEAWRPFSLVAFTSLVVEGGHLFVNNCHDFEFQKQFILELNELEARSELADRTQLFDKVIPAPVS